MSDNMEETIKAALEENPLPEPTYRVYFYLDLFEGETCPGASATVMNADSTQARKVDLVQVDFL